MYTILKAVTADHDDAAIFPVLGDDPSGVAAEPLDGEAPRRLVATAIAVDQSFPGGLTRLASVGGVRADVVVTDARVALTCGTARPGRRWPARRGTDFLVAAGLQKGSATPGGESGPDGVLVAQVRYAWLRAVGTRPRSGRAGAEALRLRVTDEADHATRELFLTLTLPKEVDGFGVAQEIAQRAARYRLTHTPVDSSRTRAVLEELTHAPLLTPAPTAFAYYQLPTYYPVGAATAYPTLAECGEPPAT